MDMVHKAIEQRGLQCLPEAKERCVFTEDQYQTAGGLAVANRQVKLVVAEK